jgi:hypothetical protein
MSSATVQGDIAASAGEFCSLAEEAVKNGAPDLVPDEVLQRVLSAAVRLYTAKCEGRPRELAPFGERPVNATEAVTAICAIMRAADLNFFDLQMWYRRAPNE